MEKKQWQLPVWPELATHSALLANSYRSLLGRALYPGHDPESEHFSERLFHCPFVLVSHGAQSEPIFNYGNALALELFELKWTDFCRLASRKSAAAELQEARASALEQVQVQGFAENYEADRISSTGRRFRIAGAVIWNLTNAQGAYCGQAAAFSRWKFDSLPPADPCE